MMDPIRTRRNRRDTGVTGTEPILGAMIWTKEYPSGRVDVRVMCPCPSNASAVGQYADGLLPEVSNDE